jgi:hypothetical protein
MANGDAPQIDWDAANTQAQSLHDTIYSLLSQWNAPGWLAEIVASSTASISFGIPLILLPAIQLAITLGSWAVTTFLGAIDEAKAANQEPINNMLASTVNEMLGTSLDGGDLNGGSGQGATMDANAAVGDALLGIFESTFGGGAPVTPDQGAANARKFAGFGINFATSQGFLSILAESASFGLLKQIHELPEVLQKSLGLSRLQRIALQPLIQNAVQKPYQKYCMAAYRPTTISEGQLVKALHSGQMSQGDVVQALQQLGYPDELIDFVLTDFEVKLGLSDLNLLLLNGDITEQDVIDNLTLAGMPEGQAQLQLKALQLSAVKSVQSGLLSWAETAYVDGFITEDQWNSILQNLMLSDLEETAIRTRVGWKQETPSKTLTFSDVQEGIVDGILNFNDLDAWFAQQHYDAASQNFLSWKVLLAMKTAEQKVAFAQYKAKVLQQAGKPVPPWITAAEQTP